MLWVRHRRSGLVRRRGFRAVPPSGGRPNDPKTVHVVPLTRIARKPIHHGEAEVERSATFRRRSQRWMMSAASDGSSYSTAR